MFRSPEDGYPRGGTDIRQEINAIRYELAVRLASWRTMYLVIRCCEDGTYTLSVRYTKSP